MSRVRGVALVGCGAIARAHAAAIAATEGVELAAVVDSDEENLGRASDEFGVVGFDRLDVLLERGGVEIACVCTPPVTHRPLAEAALEAGLDVLCEKPLATSVGDGEAMVAAAARRGRRLSVSDKFRHVSTLLEAGDRIRDGEIGRTLTYEVAFCAPVDVRGRWPSRPELSGGGVLMDNGPHAFDVLSHVLDGPVVDLDLWRSEPVLAPPVEDTAVLQFRTAGGRLGRVELSWSYYTKDLDFLVVQGTEGTLRVGWPGGQLRRHGEREWTPFGTPYSKEAAFAAMWEGFRTGEASKPRPPDALEALRWIDSAYAGAGAIPPTGR